MATKKATARKPAAAKKKPTANKKPTTRKKPAAKPPQGGDVERAMRRFLASMDALNARNDSVTDTDVREVLYGVIHGRLVEGQRVRIPARFAMMSDGELSPKEDALVHKIVRQLVDAVEASPEWRTAGAAERKAMIARDDVLSREGNAYWLYLGPWD